MFCTSFIGLLKLNCISSLLRVLRNRLIEVCPHKVESVFDLETEFERHSLDKRYAINNVVVIRFNFPDHLKNAPSSLVSSIHFVSSLPLSVISSSEDTDSTTPKTFDQTFQSTVFK